MTIPRADLEKVVEAIHIGVSCADMARLPASKSIILEALALLAPHLEASGERYGKMDTTELDISRAENAAMKKVINKMEASGDGWLPTHRHKKRGTEYELIGTGSLQTDTPLYDMQGMAVYRGNDGCLWIRSLDEFHDGRFEPLPAAPKGTKDE